MLRFWLLLTALLLPLCASAAGKQTLTPVPGLPPAPDFTLQDVDGKTWRLSELRGRPVIVNFWATWCPPCIAELPLLNTFYRENVDKGWQVLGIAVDQPSAVRTFLGKLPLEFPVAMAGLQGTELSRSLGNLGGGLPFTVLFAADGRILHRKIGQVTPENLRQWLQRM